MTLGQPGNKASLETGAGADMGSSAEKSSFALARNSQLFNAWSDNNVLDKDLLLGCLQEAGLLPDDPRCKNIYKSLAESGRELGRSEFEEIHRQAPHLIEQALQDDFIIPEFGQFRSKLSAIFNKVAGNLEGSVATYIPQLARVSPDKFALSICTIDGQRFSLGDADDLFCVQSCSKPLTYLLALEEFGDQVHQHVGREPSGKTFNELTLNSSGLPHNPMINAGAIICGSMIKPGLSPSDRFEFVLDRWRAASGGLWVGFNNSVYLSERQTADRNFALAYFMREKGAFPQGSNLMESLEFYFQCCSIELSAKAMAVVAATLANGGCCPLTGAGIFQPNYVKHCLSLMASCGMYDFSGEFAFSVGLPAKSGVSGAIMIVVPNTMGICVWSPRLDLLGNSVRGLELARELVREFSFHTFDSMVGLNQKSDPRRSSLESNISGIVLLCAAAAAGDLQQMRKLVARGVDPSACDYDGRTPLHLAACEGRLSAVEFLLKLQVKLDCFDRWGSSPLDEALKQKHERIAELLKAGSSK